MYKKGLRDQVTHFCTEKNCKILMPAYADKMQCKAKQPRTSNIAHAVKGLKFNHFCFVSDGTMMVHDIHRYNVDDC